MVVNTPVDSTT